ncbi:hypothetical protein QMK31_09010 [Cryobacterium sp. PH31-O1]|nr:hypothetical protein [Cryobacterium sp. PH31-O1]MDJ0338355.1 hypothetical protein [Cryobacterium sp. PH31-O1]
MALITRPIVIEDGVWVTARCIILGGAHIMRSAVVAPYSVVNGKIPCNVIVHGPNRLDREIRFSITTTDAPPAE